LTYNQTKIVFVGDIHLSHKNPISRVDDYLSAILNKFDFILEYAEKNNCLVLLAGDVFHTPAQPDFVKELLIPIIQIRNVPIYSIYGNHDLPFYNYDLKHKTSLNLLFKTGLIKELKEIQVNGWEICGHRMKQEFPKPKTNKSIIVSHSYYEKDDILSIPLVDIKKSKARFLCLGHDHNKYPIVDFEGTSVVRPGALSRGSIAVENFNRDISVALIDLDKEKVEYLPVPHQPATSVFIFKSDFVKEPVSFDDIRQFINQLKNSNTNKSVLDVVYGMKLTAEVQSELLYFLGLVGLSDK